MTVIHITQSVQFIKYQNGKPNLLEWCSWLVLCSENPYLVM